MNSDSVQQAIRNIEVGMKQRNYLQKKAKRYLDEISGDIKQTYVKFNAFMFHKLWRQMYDKVFINEESVNQIKSILAKENGPLVILPTHRSYLDFLIISYIFFAKNIKMPYICQQ
jgi:glycerol-3-phosphate O-acyltransferase